MTTSHGPRIFLLVALALAGRAGPLAAQRPTALTPGIVHVCADPDNLPFSNQAGEGIENKIAELLARTWNSRVEYAWWPVRRGFFSRGLNGRYCDVAITAPVGMDIAAVTGPFFRSSYAIVYRQDSGYDIRTLDDPVLKGLRIGVHLLNADAENTPPAMALSAHGIVGTLVGFGTFYSEGGLRPEDIVNAVVNKTIDVAIVWGPLAGYFIRRDNLPLVLNPVLEDPKSGIPFSYSFGMATRRRETEYRDSLQKFIDGNGPALRNILAELGIPLVPIPADSAGGHPAQ